MEEGGESATRRKNGARDAEQKYDHPMSSRDVVHRNSQGRPGYENLLEAQVRKKSDYTRLSSNQEGKTTEGKTQPEENVFVSTSHYTHALDLLTRGKVIIVTGPPGSGKTTLGRALLRHYEKEGYIPLVLRHPDDFKCEPVKSAILLDGAFGEVTVDQWSYQGWASVMESFTTLIRDGQNVIIITMYSHIMKQMEKLPKTRNFFKDIPLLDLGSAKPLTVQEKSEMIRKHTEASKRYASDDEISDIIACDKTGPFFPWCCREYARSEGKHSSTYVTFKTGPIGYEIFSSMLSLAYVSFFCKVLRDPNSQAGLLQLFALTMEGGFPVDYHIDEVQEELNNLELGAEHEQVSEMHRLNVLFRGSLLDAGGIDFSSRDIYEAFGFALFETGQVELLLRVCDVQFLVQHVHIQALETTGPALILTPRSSGYFTFVFRVMKEIVGGNCVQISQHPAMHQAPFLADVERFLRGRGLVQTAFATSDPRYGMPLLYWSAWTGPSVLTLWCLKTPGNYEAQKSPRTETGPQRMHTAKPAPAGGEGTPDWCEEDEQYDVLVPDWVQRRTSTRSTKSGSSVRRSRLPVPPANSPPTRAPSSQALLLRRMFLACCLLGEKVDTPRVAQTLELLCQDEALRDDSMSRVELPIPSEEDLLNDAIVAKCQHVRSKAPVLYLGLAGPNASVRIKSSSRVSIPTSIVKVEMNLAKDHVLIKP
ncbi:hypothetical protein BaRGS_00024616, partial [Batillaria attramentaria]